MKEGGSPDWCGSGDRSGVLYGKVAGSVPGWGAHERQSVDVSLLHPGFSPSLSLAPSLKPISMSLGKGKKIKKIKAAERNKISCIYKVHTVVFFFK